MMNDDMELVREYAARQSEQAFETLVSRNVGLVHSAALRQLRDPHQAEEITQTVFIILARKAGSLNPKTILPGWLYRTTRYVSAAAMKIQRRREYREQEAQMQAVIQEAQTSPAWEQMSPLLDEAMANLRVKDRDAIACCAIFKTGACGTWVRLWAWMNTRRKNGWPAPWKNSGRSSSNAALIQRRQPSPKRSPSIPSRPRPWRWQNP
jgi:RNA polymerase sigma factor (sigma-70 family)